ncbi:MULTISPECIES: TetR/AcrR family transcriptional regulator [unclassified Nocardia]|uniref:TetR/AcrR family transcriptional regulator n=1 Tax=unclassified Nocardia TaxID=2637762 RepID=UPI003449A2D6
MRTHGWAGARPTSDAEAVDRILEAARSAIERGIEPGIADIARTLGVTRQTVYRYFPGTEALLEAAAVRAAGDFLDRLATDLAGISDPATAVVEGIALTLERLPLEPQVALLMTPGRRSGLAAGVTSSIARDFGRSILDRFDVDWAAAGFDDGSRDELVEMMLRTLQSFIIDPGEPARDGEDMRRYLRCWVAPALEPGRVRP